jgi:hypothetical protein
VSGTALYRLEEFKSHGGKLLLWQGFADPRVPVITTQVGTTRPSGR